MVFLDKEKARLIDANKLIRRMKRVTLKNGTSLYMASKRDIDAIPTEKPEKHLEIRKVWDVTPSEFSFCKKCNRAIDPRNDSFCRGCGRTIKK